MPQAPTVTLNARHQSVRRALVELSLDALVVTALPNVLYLTNFGGSSANTLAHSNAYASRFALKRPQHQLAFFENIEPSPIQIRHGVEEECRNVGSVSNEVTLTFQKTTKLHRKIRV